MSATKLTWPVEPVAGTAKICELQLALEDSVVLGFAMSVVLEEDCVTIFRKSWILGTVRFRSQVALVGLGFLGLTIWALERGIQGGIVSNVGETCRKW